MSRMSGSCCAAATNGAAAGAAAQAPAPTNEAMEELRSGKHLGEDQGAVHDSVKQYYGEASPRGGVARHRVLETSKDLKTSACCAAGAPPPLVREALKRVPHEVLDKFYGCGSPMPVGIEGLRVLDLGSGSGRDCYVCAALVGESGSVTGVDMTGPQARGCEWVPQPNLRFVEGRIERLDEAGIADASVDLVISNCVVNLSPDKARVLREVARVLAPGGEMHFSDVYCDRRLPAEVCAESGGQGSACRARQVRMHPVLLGECLGGALYVQDFIRLCREVGFLDPRQLSSAAIEVTDPELAALLGSARFYSITYRLFKLPGVIETLCEDYGQACKYKARGSLLWLDLGALTLALAVTCFFGSCFGCGFAALAGTIPGSPHAFKLDDHHTFQTSKWYEVCGNTAAMVGDSWLGRHFEVVGDRSTHYGLFACGAAPAAPAAGGASWIVQQRAGSRPPTSPMTNQSLEHLQLTPNHMSCPMEHDICALVAQLDSRDEAAQQAAATELGKLADDSSANQEAITAAGAIPCLVRLLDAASVSVQVVATDTLCALVYRCPSNREAIAAAGAIPRLVCLLGSSDEVAQRTAAEALKDLASNSPSIREAIAAAGAIPALVCLLDAVAEATQEAAVVALSRLSICSRPCICYWAPSNREAVAAAGAIPPLVRLLDATAGATHRVAAVTLGSLTADCPPKRAAIAAAGAIPPLVRLLGAASEDTQQTAAVMLGCLANNSPSNKEAIAAAGAIPALVRLLDSGGDATQTIAGKALCVICGASPFLQDAMPPLVSMLNASAEPFQEAAAAVLGNLCRSRPSTREAIAAAGAIPHLVGLLDANSEGTQRAAVRALSGLAIEAANQAAIVAAGGIPVLQHFAARSDDEDARQLAASTVDCLQRFAEQRAAAAAAELLDEEERQAVQQAAKAAAKAAKRQQQKERRRSAAATDAAAAEAPAAAEQHAEASKAEAGSRARAAEQQTGQSESPATGAEEVLEPGAAEGVAGSETDAELAQLMLAMGVSEAVAGTWGGAEPVAAAVAGSPAGVAHPVYSPTREQLLQPPAAAQQQQHGRQEAQASASAGPQESRAASAAALDALVGELVCPITHEPMRDSVVVADGRTYERAAIQA
eukprot:scaffold24.g2978.t1